MNSYQNDRHVIDTLYFQTESRFMQRAKSCIGDSLAKKPKIFFFQIKQEGLPNYNAKTIEMK